MGHDETGDPSVTEETSLPVQSCYGPGMVPSPYFSSAVAPGQAPHAYMWGPQMGSPPSMVMPAKSLAVRDKLPTKRHKGTNGLSTSNGNIQSSIGTDVNGLSQSGYHSADGSSHGSSGNNTTECNDAKSPRLRSSEDIPSSGKPLGAEPSHCPTPTMETRITDIGKVKAIGTPIPPATGVSVPARNGVPPEIWMQDEREGKRERRKQSNRESARRSRLRKQAETEELAVKVDALNAENAILKSEISRLTETSDKLRLENLALTERLKNIQSRRTLEFSLEKMETERPPVAENFLSIIDNPSSITRADQKQKDSDDMPTRKLHLLVSNSPRTDAVTAS